MSKTILTLVLAMLPILIWGAGTDPIHTTSTLTSVTVFIHGAELHAKAQAQLPAGNRDIIVEGVPITIVPQTIQASGYGDFTILSVQYHTNFLKHKVQDAEVKRWQDSLEMLDIEIRKLNNIKFVDAAQAGVLEDNKKIASTTSGLNPDAYQKILDIYVAKMTKIKEDELNADIAISKLNKKVNYLKKELEPYPDVATGEIIVSVNCKAATLASLNISYVVNNAGWTPEYDIRCTNINQPLSIIYKAQVYQNCGMDWNNVKLTINTGNPAQSAYGQQLIPWYLDFIYKDDPGTSRLYRKYYKLHESAKNDSDGLMDSNKNIASRGSYAPPAPATYSWATTEVTLSPVSIEYAIDQSYTIPSDNMQHTVEMQNKSIPVTYHYYAAPKLDKDAFLMADITHWDTLNFMPGNANIFFQGTYVGQSAITTDNTSDTLSLSLGRDKSIVVKRTAVKDYTRTRFLSDKVSKSFGYAISVRNTRAQAIDIQLFDQLPVSNNNDIQVTDTSYAGGKIEPATGKIEWDLHINGSDEKKVTLEYTVRYPKGKSVNGL